MDAPAGIDLVLMAAHWLPEWSDRSDLVWKIGPADPGVS